MIYVFILGIMVFFLVIVTCIVISIHSSSSRNNYVCSSWHAPKQHNLQQGFDSLNLPAHLSDDEKSLLRKVADYSGKRYITDKDMEAYTIHRIDEEFQIMDGWCEWDRSIHEQPGQYERLKRGVMEKLSVMAYDSNQKIAKVKGSTGRFYLTSYQQCSCPDFKARHIPCKHMYSLCMALDGNPEQAIVSSSAKNLTGLQIALAGRFGSKNDPNGIRARINARGGEWSETIGKETSLMVCGKDPSEAKIQAARNYGAFVIDELDLDDLFGGA